MNNDWPKTGKYETSLIYELARAIAAARFFSPRTAISPQALRSAAHDYWSEDTPERWRRNGSTGFVQGKENMNTTRRSFMKFFAAMPALFHKREPDSEVDERMVEPDSEPVDEQVIGVILSASESESNTGFRSAQGSIDNSI